METIHTLLFVLQVFVSLALIVFILIQHGKGADAGAAFGSGASTTVFGARGSGNFLTKATAVLAFVFLGNSLLLGYLAGKGETPVNSLLESEPAAVIQDKKVDAQPETRTIEIPLQTTATDVPADVPAQANPPADVPVDVPPTDVPVVPETPAPPASDVPAPSEQ